MDEVFEQEGRGRSARKRAARQVEKLAIQLAELAEKDVVSLPLPDELGEPLEQARSTRGHSSRRRAVRHLAGLLRRDEELVRQLEEHLAGLSEAHWQQQARFHHLEALRDRLCDPATSGAAISELGSHLDVDRLRELRRYARAACGGDRGAARRVFRLLRESDETGVLSGK